MLSEFEIARDEKRRTSAMKAHYAMYTPSQVDCMRATLYIYEILEIRDPNTNHSGHRSYTWNGYNDDYDNEWVVGLKEMPKNDVIDTFEDHYYGEDTFRALVSRDDFWSPEYLDTVNDTGQQACEKERGLLPKVYVFERENRKKD
jgi:hypothetical protein